MLQSQVDGVPQLKSYFTGINFDSRQALNDLQRYLNRMGFRDHKNELEKVLSDFISDTIMFRTTPKVFMVEAIKSVLLHVSRRNLYNEVATNLVNEWIYSEEHGKEPQT